MRLDCRDNYFIVKVNIQSLMQLLHYACHQIFHPLYAVFGPLIILDRFNVRLAHCQLLHGGKLAVERNKPDAVT